MSQSRMLWLQWQMYDVSLCLDLSLGFSVVERLIMGALHSPEWGKGMSPVSLEMVKPESRRDS